MPLTIYIALAGWFALSLWLVSTFGSVRGLPMAIVGGFLLLPPASIPVVDGLPPIDRGMVIAISAATAVLLFDPEVLKRYRYHWLDLLPLTAASAWGVTNLANGVSISQFILDIWWYAMFALIPYFLARCVLGGVSGLRATSMAIVAGTLVLLPLVLYEVRMSPVLNLQIYGFSTGNVMERFRFDGWRPRVFQPAGLGLAVWLAGAAVVAWSLYLANARQTVLRLPPAAAAWCCVALGFLSRGAGAIALMLMGLAALFAARWIGARRLVLVIPIACTLYIGTALVETSLPIRTGLLDISSGVFGGDRAASLKTRFRNEEILVARALQKPLLGWGGWGDYRMAYDLAVEAGMTSILTDGFWVIVLGKRGLIGLLATWGWFLMPAAVAIWQAARVGAPREVFLLIVGLSLFTWIYAIDLLFNSFPSPVQALASGAIVTVVAQLRRVPSKGTAASTSRDAKDRLPSRLRSNGTPALAAVRP